MLTLIQAAAPPYLDLIRELFSEYLNWVAAETSFDLSYQHVHDELAALPGYYSPPQGRLLLALVDGQAAGCAGIRPLEKGVCELKRMYVRPAYRGKGLGRALCVYAIEEAKSAGYQIMRLDTADFLTTAQHLYTSLGFQVIEPYYSVPEDILRKSIFMELPLIQ